MNKSELKERIEKLNTRVYRNGKTLIYTGEEFRKVYSAIWDLKGEQKANEFGEVFLLGYIKNHVRSVGTIAALLDFNGSDSLVNHILRKHKHVNNPAYKELSIFCKAVKDNNDYQRRLIASVFEKNMER